MLACFLAKRLGAKYTVARIRQSDYNEDGLDFLCKQLDLSMSVNPELLTAESIYNTLRLPSAVVVDTFAGKKNTNFGNDRAREIRSVGRNPCRST